jgi:hypothetical protein
MTLIQIPTEQTTAATDLLICIMAIGGLAYLWGQGPSGLRGLLWRSVFALLAAASFLGAVAHGVVLSDAVFESVWRVTYLALAFLVAAFFAAAVRDVFGDKLARRILPLMVITAVGFYAWFVANPDDFRPFILYEASAMLLALAGFVWLSWKGSLVGSRWIAASIAVNIVAAAVQAGGSARFTLIWPFDHNGVFHLIQLLGIALLVRGLRTSPGS